MGDAPDSDVEADRVSGYDGCRRAAFDWTATRIRYTVDGQLYGRTTRAHFGTAWQYDHPFYLILNLAVGGEWPGHPTARTRFPMVMKVDYVKATTL